MKFYFLLTATVLVLFSQSVLAQEARCYTDEMYQQMMSADPEYARSRAELETFTKKWIAEHANDQSNNVNGSANKIIPVVFHILHNYGSENISDAQIIDALRVWNLDCQKLNPDLSEVVPSFTSITASLGLEFRLATKDPSGNCTNGIDRIPTLKTYLADEPSKLNPWPNNKYLNVWVAASLLKQNVAAYATFPGGGSSTDGVMCWNIYVGSIGTSIAGRSRTLTHEIGHFFNLSHVWGSSTVGTTCGDDGVSDTPITKGYDNVCNVTGSICNPPVVENVQNFMDYSYCFRMFTNGQNSRVQACLASGTGGRNNLWAAANLIATGTADPYDYNNKPLCAPVADFNTPRRTLCAGDSIRFSDLSSRGKPSGWNWNFQGGTPATSTDSMPWVKYTALGTYNVTLTSSNAAGSSAPTTKTLYVQVIDPTPQPLPATEGFESATFTPPNTVLINSDNSNTWKRTTTAHSVGTACMMIANYGYTAGAIDQYITPAYDFTDKAPSLTWDRAYAYLSTDTTRLDVLKIYYSVNCGQTWTLRASRAAGTLITTTKQPGGWSPTSASQWKADSIPGLYKLAAVVGKPNVRFMFESTSAAGNNLYLDNINVTAYSTVGIEDPNSPVSSFVVYPNPAKEQINISVTLENASDLKIELYDITGRKISDVADEKIATGVNNFLISQQLQDGVYFVRLTTGNTTSSKRVVVLD